MGSKSISTKEKIGEIVTQLRKFLDPNLLSSNRIKIIEINENENNIVLHEDSSSAKLKKMIITGIPIPSEDIVPLRVSEKVVYFFKNKDNCETALLLLSKSRDNPHIYVILPEMKSSIKKI